MAVYVLIRKISENDQFAEYEYGPNEDRLGKIKLIKFSGESEIIQEVTGDENQIYSARAARKLFLHWKNGEFPDRTCWAS